MSHFHAVTTKDGRVFRFTSLSNAQAALTILEALTGRPVALDRGLIVHESLVTFLKTIAELEWPAEWPRELARNLTRAEQERAP